MNSNRQRLLCRIFGHPMVPHHDAQRGPYLRCHICDPVVARSTSPLPPGDVERGTTGSTREPSERPLSGSPARAREPRRPSHPPLTGACR